MAKTTPEERSKIASRNGKKGGAIKKAEAYGRILISINQVISYELKMTVSEVARRSKCDPKTVRKYFKENDWKELSRKEGWKQCK